MEAGHNELPFLARGGDAAVVARDLDEDAVCIDVKP